MTKENFIQMLILRYGDNATTVKNCLELFETLSSTKKEENSPDNNIAKLSKKEEIASALRKECPHWADNLLNSFYSKNLTGALYKKTRAQYNGGFKAFWEHIVSSGVLTHKPTMTKIAYTHNEFNANWRCLSSEKRTRISPTGKYQVDRYKLCEELLSMNCGDPTVPKLIMSFKSLKD